MLVLTRRVGETLVLEGGIRLTILGLRSSKQVVVGVEAPAHVGIVREEVLLRQTAVREDTKDD